MWQIIVSTVYNSFKLSILESTLKASTFFVVFLKLLQVFQSLESYCKKCKRLKFLKPDTKLKLVKKFGTFELFSEPAERLD